MSEAKLATMPSVSLEIQSRLAKADNYNRWIYSQIEPYVGNRILDVGCAIGNITQFYVDRELVIGVDVVAEELEIARERFAGKNFEVHELDASSDALLQFKGQRLDTIVCLNVLEHVEDDVHTMRNMRQILVPGGYACLLVPVNKWLYGPMDAVDHHYRRYSRAEMTAKIEEAGLELVAQRNFNMLGIPAWFFTNRLLRRSMAAPAQYSIYDKLVPALRAAEKAFAPPYGLSLVSICRAPR